MKKLENTNLIIQKHFIKLCTNEKAGKHKPDNTKTIY